MPDANYGNVSINFASRLISLNNSPFGSISKCQNELQEQEEHISVFQEIVDNRRRIVTEWPSLIFVCTAGSSNKIHDNRSGEPERS